MTQEQVDLARLRMKASRESLREARTMVESEMWRGATNRLYYACFYAASAILILDGKESKKHSGIESMFLVDYIQSGQIPKELGRFYSKLFKTRLASDYIVQEPPSADGIPKWLDNAEELLRAIEGKINERAQGEVDLT